MVFNNGAHTNRNGRIIKGFKQQDGFNLNCTLDFYFIPLAQAGSWCDSQGSLLVTGCQESTCLMTVSAQLTQVSAAKLILVSTVHSSASLLDRPPPPAGQGKQGKTANLHDSSLDSTFPVILGE